MITVITPLFGDPSEAAGVSLTRNALANQTADVEHIIVATVAGAAIEPLDGLPTRSVVVGAAGDWLSAGLAAASGEAFSVLFAGDRCAPNALQVLSETLAASGSAAMAYSDHRIPVSELPALDTETLDESLDAIANQRADIVLKPALSTEFLRGKNYVANAAVFDRRRIGDAPYLPAPIDAIHDLVLRAAETGAVQVANPLFDLSGPVADLTASRSAVERSLERENVPATVTEGPAGSVRVRYQPRDHPVVSIIIPTRGSAGREWGATRSYVVDAVGSICTRSTYQQLEFVIVYDDVTPLATLAAIDRVAGQRTTFVEYAKPFSFSDKINVGAAAATGELLLLLNDDTELVEAGSIAELVALAQRPGVGTVGARLLYADATLQHGGHVYSGEMLHACEGWPGDSPGPRPLTPLAVTRETTGVTAAAAMVRRTVFDEVGGFSPDFPVNFNDVDFCLKLVAAGYRNLWTPDAVWYHFESVSRGRGYDDAEVDRIFARWGQQLQRDPYYNPQLLPKRGDWLEQPGLAAW